MDSGKLESDAINLACFFAVSAKELLTDPRLYGPMRMMEATQRLAKMVESSGVHSELLSEVSRRIEAFPIGSLPDGEEEFVAFVDELVLFLASWVSQH